LGGFKTPIPPNPTVRMPSLAAISIYVADMDAAISFYEKALGLTVRNRFGPDTTELAHDAPAIILCKAESRGSMAYPSGSGAVLGFATPDVDATQRSLEAMKADLVFDGPQDFPQGRFIAVRDPSGNVIEMLQFSENA
jgi:lactoylglutathione lyase